MTSLDGGAWTQEMPHTELVSSGHNIPIILIAMHKFNSPQVSYLVHTGILDSVLWVDP